MRQLSREACSPYWEMPDEVGLRLGGIAGVVIVRRGGLFLLAAGGEGQGQCQQGSGERKQLFHKIVSYSDRKVVWYG